MTPESKVLKSIVAFLEAMRLDGRPIYWVKLHGSNFQRAGIPDLLVVLSGRAFFFEVKSETGEPTKLQVHTLEKIKASGAKAMVVRSRHDVAAVLEEMFV
jgi:Holliday junction resolvase